MVWGLKGPLKGEKSRKVAHNEEQFVRDLLFLQGICPPTSNTLYCHIFNFKDLEKRRPPIFFNLKLLDYLAV